MAGLKAVVHINHAEHQRTHGEAVKRGLERHGIAVEFAAYNGWKPADFSVCWGVRQREVMKRARRVLVMERGYVGNRFAWTSCGWDGLNGRARFPDPADDGARFDEHFGHLLRPWRQSIGYALLIGQVPGDASIAGVDFAGWLRRTQQELEAQGWEVRFRPHPMTATVPPLLEELEGAGLVVTYNSNAGVEAVLYGVPTVAMDEGSMAWPVATHSVAAEPQQPDRSAWCRRLSWCQWRLDEITNGAMWEHLRMGL